MPDKIRLRLAGFCNRRWPDIRRSLYRFNRCHCCFHSFFLQPLSVTLPYAARFTGGGDNEPRAEAHTKPSES
jgi:hypothetical protein